VVRSLEVHQVGRESNGLENDILSTGGNPEISKAEADGTHKLE